MKPELQYIRAFNDGYVLAKHAPKLFQTISQNLAPTSNYLEGLFDGRNQHDTEQRYENLNEIDQLRSLSKSRGRNVGRE